MSFLVVEVSGDYTVTWVSEERCSSPLAALFYFPPEWAHLNRRRRSADVYISMHYSATSRHNKERPSSTRPPSQKKKSPLRMIIFIIPPPRPFPPCRALLIPSFKTAALLQTPETLDFLFFILTFCLLSFAQIYTRPFQVRWSILSYIKWRQKSFDNFYIQKSLSDNLLLLLFFRQTLW